MHFLVWSLKGLQVRVAVVIEIANDDDRITGKWATSSCFCPGSFEDPHRFSRGDVGVIRSPEALAGSCDLLSLLFRRQCPAAVYRSRVEDSPRTARKRTERLNSLWDKTHGCK